MKTEDTEALGKQRAKPSKIKARYSQPTCKNCSYLCAPLSFDDDDVSSSTTTSFDDDDNALKYTELSYHKQVALCIIGYNSITVCSDEYDSRHNGIGYQHPHFCILTVISADNICNICPHFTRSNIQTSTDLHIRILQ